MYSIQTDVPLLSTARSYVSVVTTVRLVWPELPRGVVVQSKLVHLLHTKQTADMYAIKEI